MGLVDDHDLQVTCPQNSEEALKLWNNAVWETLEFSPDMGMAKCFQALELDHDFVMPKVLISGLLALAGFPKSHSLLQKHFPPFICDTESVKFSIECNDREFKHLQAIWCWTDKKFDKASDIWYDIIVEYPFDILAIKFLQTSFILIHSTTRLRVLFGQLLPFWESSAYPTVGFFKGMCSFAWEENREFLQAEIFAKEALAVNSKDIWSTHALTHIYIEQSRSEEGISFLNSTESIWSSQFALTCHVYWHLALFYVDISEFEKALDVFNEHIMQAIHRSNGFALDICDACSLLWRMELLNVDVGDRWSLLNEYIDSQKYSQIYTYNICHFMMNLVRRDDVQEVEKYMQLYENSSTIPNGEVISPILKSIRDFELEDYQESFNSLLEIRYEFYKVGGSGAQRDVFFWTLLESAIRAKDWKHSEMFLNEKLSFNPDSKMFHKLRQKVRQSIYHLESPETTTL